MWVAAAAETIQVRPLAKQPISFCKFSLLRLPPDLFLSNTAIDIDKKSTSCIYSFSNDEQNWHQQMDLSKERESSGFDPQTGLFPLHSQFS